MISLEKERQVRQLLNEKISLREISRRLEVSRDTIRTIKKSPGLRKRKRLPVPLKKLNKPRRCKTCGGMIEFQECLICFPGEADYDNDRPSREISEQVNFIWDVWELYELKVIKHKLFMDLAHRAKHILAKVRKSNAKEKT